MSSRRVHELSLLRIKIWNIVEYRSTPTHRDTILIGIVWAWYFRTSLRMLRLQCHAKLLRILKPIWGSPSVFACATWQNNHRLALLSKSCFWHSTKTKIVDRVLEISSGLASQGLSIEPSNTLSTALLETTDHFKTLDFWVRNLDLLVVRCPAS